MSDRYADWVPIVPGAGELKETARALLSIGGPANVRTEDNGTTFSVPPWVAEQFTTPEQPTAPKRRPRARKSEE